MPTRLAEGLKTPRRPPRSLQSEGSFKVRFVSHGRFILLDVFLDISHDRSGGWALHRICVRSEGPSESDRYRYLLSRLDDCVSFICDALSTHSESKPSAVLVHCHVGQSRSAAVVTAYLMKTQHLNLQDAYTKLQNLKPDVKMNEEFMDQLALYELMECKVDTTNPLYKQFRLKKITEKYPELQNVPKDVFAVDPAQTQNAEAVYRCRKCRRTLFRHSSILSHCVGIGASAFSHKKTRIVSDSEDQRQCTSYFIEPVQWMEPALLGVMDGQLLCPKCSSKLGSFNWYGEQCSCGRWVTPAFQMHKNRVDEIKHISLPALK
ncbi:hypothetical protein Q8A67_009224 [Cirrhinus molitorella]|uniref:protein-tyrosine-phosphatase n=1 Tax=Cirrhinus molitorella TaxID=172907 RepID=A0AA88Q1E7_9TELE|nr:hypothetical protein Q8A67_009224 [Cirrhinus molitorella]